jgi:UDP-N-acetylmuramyl tripeptide synthase
VNNPPRAFLFGQGGEEMNIKRRLMGLVKDCYEDEVAHTELRMIRDAQKPRFEALKNKYPEIYEDFMRAHVTVHEILRENRRKRLEILDDIILEMENKK